MRSIASRRTQGDRPSVVARTRALLPDAERLGQALQHLLRHDLPEARDLALPVHQDLLGEARLRLAHVLLDQRLEQVGPIGCGDPLPDYGLRIDPMREL